MKLLRRLWWTTTYKPAHVMECDWCKADTKVAIIGDSSSGNWRNYYYICKDCYVYGYKPSLRNVVK